jgi:hypothetical protein
LTVPRSLQINQKVVYVDVESGEISMPSMSRRRNFILLLYRYVAGIRQSDLHMIPQEITDRLEKNWSISSIHNIIKSIPANS